MNCVYHIYALEFSKYYHIFTPFSKVGRVAILWIICLFAAAAAAKALQSCPILCDSIDGSHQAPPSPRFSRQEHWSGLPFPSPMHESEK